MYSSHTDGILKMHLFISEAVFVYRKDLDNNV